jgi:signal transduction histidine kinase
MLPVHPSNGRKTISLVERGIHHLNKLVVDVTQFSRRRTDRRLDLQEVIESSIELVADQAVTSGLRSKKVRGAGDPGKLGQRAVAQFSLTCWPMPLTRATAFAGRDLGGSDCGRGAGHPFNRGSFPMESASIVITDHGAGIDQKAQSPLLAVLHYEKRGTGLGLSIVQIIDLHGESSTSKAAPVARALIDLPVRSFRTKRRPVT